MAADPRAEQCGWLKDKYGLSWQIAPAILSKLLGGDDKKRIERITQAFLEMKKFDIGALKRRPPARAPKLGRFPADRRPLNSVRIARSANNVRHIVVIRRFTFASSLSERFSGLVVFDAHLYIRVRRIDEPA